MKEKMKSAFLAVLATMGLAGCYGLQPVRIADVDSKGKGEMFVIVDGGASPSVESVCAAAPMGSEDERCKNQNLYYARMVTHVVGGFASNLYPVLIPKTEQVNASAFNSDILKVRLKDGVPAYFEFVASRGRKDDPECYYEGAFGRGSGGAGGVVCPKYNWNYREHISN